jgi:hypothetical protein
MLAGGGWFAVDHEAHEAKEKPGQNHCTSCQSDSTSDHSALEGKSEEIIEVRHEVSKGVEEGRWLPALRAATPSGGHPCRQLPPQGRFSDGRPKGVEGLVMAGRSDTLEEMHVILHRTVYCLFI